MSQAELEHQQSALLESLILIRRTHSIIYWPGSWTRVAKFLDISPMDRDILGLTSNEKLAQCGIELGPSASEVIRLICITLTGTS